MTVTQIKLRNGNPTLCEWLEVGSTGAGFKLRTRRSLFPLVTNAQYARHESRVARGGARQDDGTQPWTDCVFFFFFRGSRECSLGVGGDGVEEGY